MADGMTYAERNAVRNETLREAAEMVREFVVFEGDDVSPSAARAETACRHAFASALEGMQRK